MRHLVELVRGLLEFALFMYLPIGFALTGWYITIGQPENGMWFAAAWVASVVFLLFHE